MDSRPEVMTDNHNQQKMASSTHKIGPLYPTVFEGGGGGGAESGRVWGWVADDEGKGDGAWC